MELYRYYNKQVRITLNDSSVFEGLACDYINAQDNVPEIASIFLGDIEFYENEIALIEEISST